VGDAVQIRKATGATFVGAHVMEVYAKSKATKRQCLTSVELRAPGETYQF